MRNQGHAIIGISSLYYLRCIFCLLYLFLFLYSIWRIHCMCQQPLSEWSNLLWSQWWQWLCLSLSCWLWGNQLWKWYTFSSIYIIHVINLFTAHTGEQVLSSLYLAFILPDSLCYCSGLSCLKFVVHLPLHISFWNQYIIMLFLSDRNSSMCQQPLSEWSNLFWSQWWQWLCLSLSCWLWRNQLCKWYIASHLWLWCIL